MTKITFGIQVTCIRFFCMHFLLSDIQYMHMYRSTPPTSNVQLTGAECTDDGPGRNTGNRFNIGKCSFSGECDANGQYAGVVCSSGSSKCMTLAKQTCFGSY